MGERDAHAITEDIMSYKPQQFSIKYNSVIFEQDFYHLIYLLEEGIPVKYYKRFSGFHKKHTAIFDDEKADVVGDIKRYRVDKAKLSDYYKAWSFIQVERDLIIDVLKFMCPAFKELQPGETTTALGCLVDSNNGYKEIEDDRIYPNIFLDILNNDIDTILNGILYSFVSEQACLPMDNMVHEEYFMMEKYIYPNGREPIKPLLLEVGKPVILQEEKHEIDLVEEYILKAFCEHIKNENNISILQPTWNDENKKYVIHNVKKYRKLPNITSYDAEALKIDNEYNGCEDSTYKYAHRIAEDMLNIHVHVDLDIENKKYHPRNTGIEYSKETFIEKHPKYLFNENVISGKYLDDAFENVSNFLDFLEEMANG